MIKIVGFAALTLARKQLKYNEDGTGQFSLLTNATEFFCIDLDKAVGVYGNPVETNYIDYTEQTLTEFLPSFSIDAFV